MKRRDAIKNPSSIAVTSGVATSILSPRLDIALIPEAIAFFWDYAKTLL